MYIVPITYPGVSLEFEPRDTGFQMESLLRNMTSGLTEAAIALGWFEAERSNQEGSRTTWDRSAAIREEARSAVRAATGGDIRSMDFQR